MASRRQKCLLTSINFAIHSVFKYIFREGVRRIHQTVKGVHGTKMLRRLLFNIKILDFVIERQYFCLQVLNKSQSVPCQGVFLKFFSSWYDSPQWARASFWWRLHDYTQIHQDPQDFSGRVISQKQRPLPDNTQHLEETNIHAAGGIRTQISGGEHPPYTARLLGSALSYSTRKLKPIKYNLLGRNS